MNFTFEFDNDMRFGFENAVPQTDNTSMSAYIAASGSTGITGDLIELSDTEEE